MSGPRQIGIKVRGSEYQSIMDGLKTFIIRDNNINFKPGMIVTLQEWSIPDEAFTGREQRVEVTYVTDFNQRPNNVVWSFRMVQ